MDERFMDHAADEWLNICQAAAAFPGHPSAGAVSRWATRGVRGHVLPSTMVGGRRMIRRSDIEKFLKDLNEKEFPEEIEPNDNCSTFVDVLLPVGIFFSRFLDFFAGVW